MRSGLAPGVTMAAHFGHIGFGFECGHDHMQMLYVPQINVNQQAIKIWFAVNEL
jgi:hypothetical protein